ncbi:MAG: helix-turn-helix transcriptional regulator [Pseudomonadota bacterium]
MPRRKSTEEEPIFNRLAALRADRSLSRKALADAVGVHVQTIGYLERGEYKPSLLMAMKLARLFDLPVEAIFSLEPLRPMSEQLFPQPAAGDGTNGSHHDE